jgi:hypothetical protein
VASRPDKNKVCRISYLDYVASNLSER